MLSILINILINVLIDVNMYHNPLFCERNLFHFPGTKVFQTSYMFTKAEFGFRDEMWNLTEMNVKNGVYLTNVCKYSIAILKYFHCFVFFFLF